MQAKVTNQWYMGSGAGAHVINNKDFFQECNQERKEKSSLADFIQSEGIQSGIINYEIMPADDTRDSWADVLFVALLQESLAC